MGLFNLNNSIVSVRKNGSIHLGVRNLRTNVKRTF